MISDITLCWIPMFHCVTRGGLKSNADGFSERVGLGSAPADVRDWSVPKSSLEFSTPGAFAIMSNTWLPWGRS